MTEPVFDKKEIQQILKKASEIQTQKDLYGDKEGLTRGELEVLAKEVGIDADSLNQAILNRESDSFNTYYNWIKGTSKVQAVQVIDGEVTKENWDEIIREIRKVIGGIGKDTNQRNSFEWEQRLKEIGYRHISLTPKDGKTTVQYVYHWKGLQFMSNMFGFIFPAIFVAGSVADTGASVLMYLLIGGLAGLTGIMTTRLFLKPYFEKQKKLMTETIQTISRKLQLYVTPATIRVEEDAYGEAGTLSSTHSTRKQES